MTDRRAISVGDLAVVVLPKFCCGRDHGVGVIIKVLALDNDVAICSQCRNISRRELFAQFGKNSWIEVARLKRIPPLEELDEVRTSDEVTA